MGGKAAGLMGIAKIEIAKDPRIEKLPNPRESAFISGKGFAFQILAIFGSFVIAGN